MISIIFSLVLILYTLYIKFSGLAVPGTAGIIISISFFSGVILFTLGITSVYIARIFEEVRGRKSYIVKDIIKSDTEEL